MVYVYILQPPFDLFDEHSFGFRLLYYKFFCFLIY